MKKQSSLKSILYSLAGGAALIFLAANFAFSQTEKTLLSGSEFAEKFSKAENAVLIDVRTPAEFSSGHIASAINIDYENPNFADEVKKLDPNKNYFIYCRSGNRSGKASAIMKSAGIKNIYDLQGGIVSSPGLLQR